MTTDNQNLPPGSPSDEVDPLSHAAGGIDTTFPLLQPDRTMRLECISAKIGPVKTDESRNTLCLICKTTTEGTFVNGKTAHAGFKLKRYYSVSPSEGKDGKEGRTNKDIARDLALLLKAFFGPATTVTPRDLLNNPAQLEGRPVDARITIEKGSGSFSDKNGINFVIPA